MLVETRRCAAGEAHIQFAIYPGMDLSHYLAERERWKWDALEITLTGIHYLAGLHLTTNSSQRLNWK